MWHNDTQTALTWTHHHVAQDLKLRWVKQIALHEVQTLKQKLIFFHLTSVATFNAFMLLCFHASCSVLFTFKQFSLLQSFSTPRWCCWTRWETKQNKKKSQPTLKKCNCFKHKIFTTLLIFLSCASFNSEWMFHNGTTLQATATETLRERKGEKCLCNTCDSPSRMVSIHAFDSRVGE